MISRNENTAVIHHENEQRAIMEEAKKLRPLVEQAGDGLTLTFANNPSPELMHAWATAYGLHRHLLERENKLGEIHLNFSSSVQDDILLALAQSNVPTAGLREFEEHQLNILKTMRAKPVGASKIGDVVAVDFADSNRHFRVSEADLRFRKVHVAHWARANGVTIYEGATNRTDNKTVFLQFQTPEQQAAVLAMLGRSGIDSRDLYRFTPDELTAMHDKIRLLTPKAVELFGRGDRVRFVFEGLEQGNNHAWARVNGLTIADTQGVTLENDEMLIEFSTPQQRQAVFRMLSRGADKEIKMPEFSDDALEVIKNGAPDAVSPISAQSFNEGIGLRFPEGTTAEQMQAWQVYHGLTRTQHSRGYDGMLKDFSNFPMLLNPDPQHYAVNIAALRSAGISADNLHDFSDKELVAITGATRPEGKPLQQVVGEKYSFGGFLKSLSSTGRGLGGNSYRPRGGFGNEGSE